MILEYTIYKDRDCTIVKKCVALVGGAAVIRYAVFKKLKGGELEVWQGDIIAGCRIDRIIEGEGTHDTSAIPRH